MHYFSESQPGAGLTAVNYVSTSGNYKQTMNNANVVIDGSSGGERNRFVGLHC